PGIVVSAAPPAAGRTCRKRGGLEAPGGFEPPNNGFAVRCLTTWLRRHSAFKPAHCRTVYQRPDKAASAATGPCVDSALCPATAARPGRRHRCGADQVVGATPESLVVRSRRAQDGLQHGWDRATSRTVTGAGG